MIEVESKLKRWGRSFGVVIPMEKVKEANLSENDALDIVITKKDNPLKQTFGILKGKLKKSTEQILKEGDKESWDE